MTAPIEDVSSLPGKQVSDQQGATIGKVDEIYATDGDGQPVWVGIEGSFGSGNKRTVLIPIARLKDENGKIAVPYSKDRIAESPEVDVSDGVSVEADRELRGYYGIGIGDQELWADNKSYATLVPEEPAEAKRVEDAQQLETPDADKRTEESMERMRDSQRREARGGGVSDVTGEEDQGHAAEEDHADRDEDHADEENNADEEDNPDGDQPDEQRS